MKKFLACGVAAILSANVAMADFVIPAASLPGNALVGQLPGAPPDPGSHGEWDLSGATIPVATYFGYSISVDWVAGVGGPWSNEANIFFSNQSLGAVTPLVIYQNGTTADNAASSGAPITLTWNGFLTTAYQGGDPLWFLGSQSFGTSRAAWSNIAITLTTAVPPPPPSLDDFLTGTINASPFAHSSNTGDTGAIGTTNDIDGPNGFATGNWSSPDHIYKLNWGGGFINIDLLFNNTLGDIDLILFSDNTAATTLGTSTSITDNENINLATALAAGVYYIAVDGWQGATNAYTLNVTPEPASLALLAMGAAFVIRRRR